MKITLVEGTTEGKTIWRLHPTKGWRVKHGRRGKTNRRTKRIYLNLKKEKT